MNENHLRRLFPHATEAFIKANSVEDTRVRPNSEFQDSEEGDLAKAQGRIGVPLGLHRIPRKKVDAASNPKFAVTIDYLFSSYGGADPDGALSTLLDCLERAIKGLTEMDWKINGQSRQSGKRSRGGCNHNK